MNNKTLIALISLIGISLVFVPVPAGLRDASHLVSVAKQNELRLWEAAKIVSAEAGAAQPEDEVAARVRTAYARPASPDAGRKAWRLFLLFAATIALILLDVMPIFVAAIGALAISVLTGILSTEEAYSGFSEGFIILIVVAFTTAIGFAKSGLGERIAFLIIGKFGHSTLGLAYSLIATDILIAPAFPSNTARSGVLFPVVDSVARSSDSPPNRDERKRLGAFLVMASIIGLSLSSGLWLTAMAANPGGAELARKITGIEIGFATWFKAACVPTAVALVVLPLLLHWAFPPQVKRTPEARELAKQRLREKGPLSKDEKIMGAVFLVMVVFWALKSVLGVDSTAVAIAGLSVLMLSGVISIADVRASNGPMTFVWFASLYTLSKQLNEFGFMHWIGENAGNFIGGYPWPIVYVALVVAYVLIHYFFVSQTAHMYAVYPIFLAVGVNAGVPPMLLSLVLLFATNFFSPLTPQASSANAIFVGSGYLTTREVYCYGGLMVLVSTLIFLAIGSPWILFAFD